MASRLLPRIWALGERLWSNGPSYSKASSKAGMDVWMPYYPTLRAKTSQYMDRGVGVLPANTEYCFVNEEQEKMCDYWIADFYDN